MKEFFWKLLAGIGVWRMYASVIGAMCLTAFFTQGKWVVTIASGLWVLLWVYGSMANWIKTYIEEKAPIHNDGAIMNVEQKFLFFGYYIMALFPLVPLFFGFQFYGTIVNIQFSVADAIRSYLIALLASHVVILCILFPAWDHLVEVRSSLPEFQEKKPAPGGAGT
jgi:hypothetical protein